MSPMLAMLNVLCTHVQLIRIIPGVHELARGRLTLSYTEEVSLEIRYRVVKRAATLATGPRPQKLAADRDS